jgi:hypothetical protein
MANETVTILILAGLAGLALLILITWLVRAVNRTDPAANAGLRGQNSPNWASSNWGETAIMFQTLQGIVQEQKQLARDFNRSLDRKIAIVRNVVKQIVEEHERLTQSQRQLEARLAEAQAAIAGAPLPKNTTAAAAQEPAKTPILQVLPDPRGDADSDGSDDLIDTWVGLEFRDVEIPEMTETPPEIPPNREAVRAVLNMGEAPDLTWENKGRESITAIRARAYKFHDAGMSVAQIAKELGVGKGEVRLMLNLREKAE